MKLKILGLWLLIITAGKLHAAAPEKQFSQLESQPDEVITGIVSELPDPALINLSATSGRLRTFAKAELAKRPDSMWATFPVDRIDIAAGRKQCDKETYHKHITCNQAHDSIGFIFFSDDGDIIAVGSDNGLIQMRHAQTQKMTQYIERKANRVECRFAPSVKILAIYHLYEKDDSKNFTTIWDMQKGQKIKEFPANSGYISAISPNGKILAQTNRGTITLRDLEKNSSKEISHGTRYGNITFTPDGKQLATGKSEKDVCIWDVETLQQKANFESDYAWGQLLFLPDDKLISFGHHDADWCNFYFYVHDIKKNKTVRTWGPAGLSYVISNDGSLIAESARLKTEIKIWDIKSGKNVQTIELVQTDIEDQADHPTALNFSRDNTMLAVGHYNGAINIWKLRLGSHNNKSSRTK